MPPDQNPIEPPFGSVWSFDGSDVIYVAIAKGRIDQGAFQHWFFLRIHPSGHAFVDEGMTWGNFGEPGNLSYRRIDRYV